MTDNAKLVLKTILFLIVLISSLVLIKHFQKRIPSNPQSLKQNLSWWEVQSIDTMKYSRDLSREKLNDESFDVIIDNQVKDISLTGATHVVIATPYDEEFLPFLKRWVQQARQYGLKVWFRGNWAGWEGWFDYPKISRQEHLNKTEDFIVKNKDLFTDGDIFTACPECENGGPGDPRKTKDISGCREFLIKEYEVTQKAFKKINKKVSSNFNSMNGDVAKLIMNKETTEKMDGLVVIDHYVASVDTLVKDIQDLANQTKGKIILGEFGAPITDIHGQMTEKEQAKWLSEALTKLSQMPYVIGLNYWVNLGSSTQLWNSNGSPRQAVAVIYSFYTPQLAAGIVKDQLNRAVREAKISTKEKSVLTNNQGEFQLPILLTNQYLNISALGFKTQEISLNKVNQPLTATLVKEHETIFFKVKKFFLHLFSR